MTETAPVPDIEQYENEHGGYGPCERCYWAQKRSILSDARDPDPNLPIEIYYALPPATKRYDPPCKCSRWCWTEYLCDGCALTVEKPDYLEDLADDD